MATIAWEQVIADVCPLLPVDAEPGWLTFQNGVCVLSRLTFSPGPIHFGYRVDDPRHPPGAHAGETGSVLPCAVESLAAGLPFPPHHDTIMTGARWVTAPAMTPARGRPS
jgi:hypothetical protein